MKGVVTAWKSGLSASCASETLKNIAETVNTIADMNHQIAAATEEQSLVTEDINKNVNTIAEYARDTSKDVSDCKAHCDQLGKLSDDLRQLMTQFKL